MKESKINQSQNSRRKFLLQLGMIPLMATTGCSTIAKLALQYPDEYDTDMVCIENSLIAFAITIIPGAPKDDPNLIRIFSDPAYPFIKIRGFFIYTLSKMSRKKYKIDRFYNLTQAQRNEVLVEAFQLRGKKKQLFNVAAGLVQVAFYAGIYDSQKGCEMIDFEGSNYGYRPEKMFYTDCNKYKLIEETHSGNYQ